MAGLGAVCFCFGLLLYWFGLVGFLFVVWVVLGIVVVAFELFVLGCLLASVFWVGWFACGGFGCCDCYLFVVASSVFVVWVVLDFG